LRAHGGIDNWDRFRAVSARLDIGGAIWHLKGQPDLFRDIDVTANLQQQHLTVTSREGSWRGTFTPDVVGIEATDGGAVEERRDPRAGYGGHTQQTPWDRLHALYFTSYALWTYLTVPFLFTSPGFRTREISEWREAGEVWRRLRVTFPEGMTSHSREQTFYFGEDGLLRRHDYAVDIMGGAPGANYASDYRNVRGIMVPMSRRVFAHDDAGRKLDEPLLLSILDRSLTH
jgi:hypothetical protein